SLSLDTDTHRKGPPIYLRHPAYWAAILVKSYAFWLMLLQVPGAHGSTAPAGQGWSRLNDQNENHAAWLPAAKLSRLVKVAWVNSSLGWSVCPFISVIPMCDHAVADDQPYSESSWLATSLATASSLLTC